MIRLTDLVFLNNPIYRCNPSTIDGLKEFKVDEGSGLVRFIFDNKYKAIEFRRRVSFSSLALPNPPVRQLGNWERCVYDQPYFQAIEYAFGQDMEVTEIFKKIFGIDLGNCKKNDPRLPKVTLGRSNESSPTMTVKFED